MFYIFFCLCLFQRLIELIWSKRNQNALKTEGFSPKEDINHLRIMVAVHVVWFIGMVLESTFKPTSPTKATLALTALLFFLAQILRLWTMSTLGRHWNITVWAPPDAAGIDNQKESPDFVHTGPYRYIRHPNYLVVMIEFITLPIMGGAYLTAALCSVFNLLVLWRRIQVEEKYLFSRAGYRETMGMKARFIPGII